MSGSSLVPEPMSAEQVSVNVSTAVHQSAKSLGSSRRTVDVVPTFACRFLLDGALGACATGVHRRIGLDKRPLRIRNLCMRSSGGTNRRVEPLRFVDDRNVFTIYRSIRTVSEVAQLRRRGDQSRNESLG